MGVIVAHNKYWLIDDVKYISVDFINSKLNGELIAVTYKLDTRKLMFIPVSRLNELEEAERLEAWDPSELINKYTYQKYVGHEKD